MEGYTWHPFVEAGQRIDGHIEPLGCVIVDYIRVRNQISVEEACNQLQDFLMEDYLQATGPGDIPLTIAFWRYARIGPDGDAVNYQTGQHLAWFRIKAANALTLLPPPAAWVVRPPGGTADAQPAETRPAEVPAPPADKPIDQQPAQPMPTERENRVYEAALQLCQKAAAKGQRENIRNGLFFELRKEPLCAKRHEVEAAAERIRLKDATLLQSRGGSRKRTKRPNAHQTPGR